MQAPAALGLGVQITEMDFRTPDPLTAEKLQAQAQIYEPHKAGMPVPH